MKLVVLTAPSGAGKTTIARRVMETFPELSFSISATTRPIREGEDNGVDYVFLSTKEFEARVEAGEFIEYEEVYPGRYYGTPKAELEKRAQDAPLLLDIDVKGAVNVKRLYGDDVLTIFIKPPSLEVLQERLKGRGSESSETIRMRLDRAAFELGFEGQFDAVIVNDDLELAVSETEAAIRTFLVG